MEAEKPKSGGPTGLTSSEVPVVEGHVAECRGVRAHTAGRRPRAVQAQAPAFVAGTSSGLP